MLRVRGRTGGMEQYLSARQYVKRTLVVNIIE
jgi:hypothetical protein